MHKALTLSSDVDRFSPVARKEIDINKINFSGIELHDEEPPVYAAHF